MHALGDSINAFSRDYLLKVVIGTTRQTFGDNMTYPIAREWQADRLVKDRKCYHGGQEKYKIVRFPDVGERVWRRKQVSPLKALEKIDQYHLCQYPEIWSIRTCRCDHFSNCFKYFEQAPIIVLSVKLGSNAANNNRKSP